MILGIDEAGRGPWAGPLVVGAVVLGCEIEGLNDSKQLSKKRREELSAVILSEAQAAVTGWVSAHELDELGMSEALRLATRRAVEQIKVPYHEIIIDGTVNFLRGTTKENYVTVLPKADALIPTVSAASIIAKVARDAYMTALSSTYPDYQFDRNAGYGVAAHRAAIESVGVTPEHRLSFKPLQKFRGVPADTSKQVTDTAVVSKLTTRSIGDASEAIAAQALTARGHQIIARNWKTKYCEIDIVSMYEDILYFTEVKHRRTDKSGNGLSAITPKKLRQMTFAARLYLQRYAMHDTDVRLQVAATTGDPARVTDIIELT